MSEEDLYREIFEEEIGNALPPLILKLCKTFEKIKFKKESAVEDFNIVQLSDSQTKIVFAIKTPEEKRFKIAFIVENDSLEMSNIIYQEVNNVETKVVSKALSVIRKKINDMKGYYGNN